MTIRPITFTGPMVSAILDGRKTQTRRVLKPQPFIDDNRNFCTEGRDGRKWIWGQHVDGSPCVRNFIEQCVRYAPADLLYVRECWRTLAEWDDKSPSDLMAKAALWPGHDVAPLPRRYEADGFETGSVRTVGDYPIQMGRLRAAMHMPRRLSRLTLKVTDVRVERVQAISEADALAEGLVTAPGGWFSGADGMASPSPPGAFALLWDSINAARGCGWDANPWVVALTFELIRRNVDELRDLEGTS